MKKTEPEPLVLLLNDCMEVLLRQEDLLSIRWLQHPSSTHFRSSLTLLLGQLPEQRFFRLLVDARAVLYLELSDQYWLEQQLAALLPSTLLERQACVVSQLSLELMDTNRMLTHLSSQKNLQGEAIDTQFFQGVSPALEWLAQDL